MAKKHWYKLKVRQGFASIVAQRLRKIDLEVILPAEKFPEYVYCRFIPDERQSVMKVPGVVGVLEISDPNSRWEIRRANQN
jgi:transcription antitermination factor NusG